MFHLLLVLEENDEVVSELSTMFDDLSSNLEDPARKTSGTGLYD